MNTLALFYNPFVFYVLHKLHDARSTWLMMGLICLESSSEASVEFSNYLFSCRNTLGLYIPDISIIVMIGLSVPSQKQYHPRAVRSKSSTVTEFRNLTSSLNRSQCYRSNDEAYKSQAVFMLRKPLVNGVFDFYSKTNSENLFRRDNPRDYSRDNHRDNSLAQSEKEAIRKRAYSAHNMRKLKIQRNIHIDKKITAIPLMQNSSQILARFQEVSCHKQIQSKQPLFKRSRKCRLAIERFDLKNKQLARIEGLIGVRIV